MGDGIGCTFGLLAAVTTRAASSVAVTPSRLLRRRHGHNPRRR